MKERELTDAVAVIAKEDATFRLGLARALLTAAANHDAAAGERAADLKRHLPRKRIEFVNQHSSENTVGALTALQELFGRQRQLWNFVDWVWESEDFLLAVEVKINDKTIFQPDQLWNYTRAAKRADKPFYGVLALTTQQPPRDAVRRVNRRKGFVGVVLWRDVAPLLRQLKPVEPSHDQTWRQLLHAVTPLAP